MIDLSAGGIFLLLGSFKDFFCAREHYHVAVLVVFSQITSQSAFSQMLTICSVFQLVCILYYLIVAWWYQPFKTICNQADNRSANNLSSSWA